MKSTLNVLNYFVKEELEKARVSYDDQMSRKLAFDNVIESLFKKSKPESKEVSERSFSLTRISIGNPGSLCVTRDII